jgi:hypothetical protein
VVCPSDWWQEDAVARFRRGGERTCGDRDRCRIVRARRSEAQASCCQSSTLAVAWCELGAAGGTPFANPARAIRCWRPRIDAVRRLYWGLCMRNRLGCLTVTGHGGCFANGWNDDSKHACGRVCARVMGKSRNGPRGRWRRKKARGSSPIDGACPQSPGASPDFGASIKQERHSLWRPAILHGAARRLCLPLARLPLCAGPGNCGRSMQPADEHVPQ